MAKSDDSRLFSHTLVITSDTEFFRIVFWRFLVYSEQC